MHLGFELLKLTDRKFIIERSLKVKSIRNARSVVFAWTPKKAWTAEDSKDEKRITGVYEHGFVRANYTTKDYHLCPISLLKLNDFIFKYGE